MLRASGKSKPHGVRESWRVLAFSVGGRQLAVKIAEVTEILRWSSSIPVSGETPFVTAVVRLDHVVLPVFDLAAALHCGVQGSHPLCLRVKHPLGEMVICIDEAIPVLHTIDQAMIQTYRDTDLPTEGSYANGLAQIPILSVSRLGMGS